MSVRAFIPGVKYPAVSITGSKCTLNCKCCAGHYLKGMISTASPKELRDAARTLHRKGARGLLISGGFDSEGRLKIKPFLPTLKGIKREFGFVLSVHCGLVDRDVAKKIREAGIDVVDYELTIDPTVIKDVKRLKKKPADFIRSLKLLVEEGPPYVAIHIPIGFRYGEVSFELETIDAAAEFDPYLTIFLVFVPTKGTPMENISPPSIPKITDLLVYSRRKFKEVAMGCMRPWKYKLMLDPKLIAAGLIDRIAVPGRQVIIENKLQVIHACCSLPEELMNKFL